MGEEGRVRWRVCHLLQRSSAKAALDDTAASGTCSSGCITSTMSEALAARGAGSRQWGQSSALPASTRWWYTEATPLMMMETGMMVEAEQAEPRREKRAVMAWRLGARAAAVEVQRARATCATRRVFTEAAC